MAKLYHVNGNFFHWVVVEDGIIIKINPAWKIRLYEIGIDGDRYAEGRTVIFMKEFYQWEFIEVEQITA